MEDKLDIQEVKQKLIERLTPSGWAEKLKLFLISDEMDTILRTLHEQSLDGQKFTPKLSQVFRALEECPYDKVNSIIMLQDPYPYLGVADGIPTSCSNDGVIQQSLREFFNELSRTVYAGQTYVEDPDLARWCNQGVLMLNAALTTTVGSVGRHYMVWRPFLVYLLDKLVWDKPGLAYVFMGGVAQKNFAPMIPDNNLKIFVEHPAAASYRNQQGQWLGNGVFQKINDHRVKSGGEKIVW